jgi:hypothetical protein
MKSNLTLRSNVYLRQPETSLADDMAFVEQVRGIGAVHKLLGMLGVPPDKRRHGDPEIMRLARSGKLTRTHLNTLRWSLRCSECNSLPSGLTFQGAVAFRCDLPGCDEDRTPVKSVLIPDHVIRRKGQNLSLTKALDWSISQCRGVPPNVNLSPPYSRVAVRISPTADWLYTEEELSAFLTFALSHDTQW